MKIKLFAFLPVVFFTAVSFAVPEQDGKVPYQLTNTGECSMKINGQASSCPSGWQKELEAIQYYTLDRFFMMQFSNGKIMKFLELDKNGKPSQIEMCISDTGDQWSQLISCSTFGYPTTKNTKEFKDIYTADYNPNPLITMSMSRQINALDRNGKKVDGSVNIENVLFTPK